MRRPAWPDAGILTHRYKGIIIQKADTSACSACDAGEYGIAIRQFSLHKTDGLHSGVKIRTFPDDPVGVGISRKCQRIPGGQHF